MLPRIKVLLQLFCWTSSSHFSSDLSTNSETFSLGDWFCLFGAFFTWIAGLRGWSGGELTRCNCDTCEVFRKWASKSSFVIDIGSYGNTSKNLQRFKWLCNTNEAYHAQSAHDISSQFEMFVIYVAQEIHICFVGYFGDRRFSQNIKNARNGIRKQFKCFVADLKVLVSSV